MTEFSFPSDFKNIIGVGKPIKSYIHTPLSKVANVFGCLLTSAFGIYLLFDGFFLYPSKYPDVAKSNMPYIVGLGAVILFAGLYWAWRLFTRWKEMLVVYENGFVYFDGKKIQTFKWDEISSIKMRVIRQTMYGVIPLGTQRKYWISKLSGEEVKLDGSLSDPDDFIDRVRQEANPYIFARAKAIFDTDQPLDFGVISISKSRGMIKGKKNYPWSDIGQITVNQGSMWIMPKEKGSFRKFSFPVMGVPNLDILIQLSIDVAKDF